MDPEKRSPLDAWASRHLSIASAASMDILGELPPPPPPKSSGPSSAESSPAASPAKRMTSRKKHFKKTKELPPLPSAPRESQAVFELKPPSIGSVQSHKAVVSPAPIVTPRSPPQKFNFKSLDDHLRMGIYQIEAGSLEWARFHVNHARTRSLIGQLLWDVGSEMGWWLPHKPQDNYALKFTYLDDIDLSKLRRLAGIQPAPRLAVAFSTLARVDGFFDGAAALMDVPIPEISQCRGSVGKVANAAVASPSSASVSTLVATPVSSQTSLMMPHSSSPKPMRTRTPEPRLSDIPMPATPQPFAKTHGRSGSNQSLNSAHLFPYPWRHSRNNSQTSGFG